MAIGMVSLVKLQTFPVVILTLILGALIGEIINLDGKVKLVFQTVLDKFHFKIIGDREEYMRFYLIVAVTFCASGSNIFGVISEGISGDFTILFSKAVMDIFTATIFAATLGRAINLIVLPQFIILCTFFIVTSSLFPT